MILQSLYNYYQILLVDGEIAAPGYSNELVSHALNLSLQGDLLNINPLYIPVQQGKKTVDRPRRINVPERVKRSVNVAANFMCDNAIYVLGMSVKEAKDPDYAQKRFEAFRELNTQILSATNSHIARAVIAFLQNHNPQKAKDNSEIARHLDGLMQGYNLIFQVEGKEALDEENIRRAWEAYALGQEALEMQCLVTGEIEQIARLHPDIKGVRDAQSKGASLVSFNRDAFTSYGREKGANSPVSRRVASGYGVALNYLLSNQNPNRKIHLGDTTVVYWADTADKRYASAFYAFLNPEYQQEQEEESQEIKVKGKRKRAKEAEKILGEAAEAVQRGKAIDLVALSEGLDKNIRFYVLGLSPSAARLAVRFFLTEPFGVVAKRIMQHYKDLEIEKEYANQPTYLSPYRILAECVSPKVNKRDEEVKKTWSLLGGALMRSILTGAPYPEGFYAAMLNRIRHDTDETNNEGKRRNVKINYIRVAYIKAHLIRKYRRHTEKRYQEALQMSLNESYTHPAYVLGRLFAWLERAQREALGKNINATVKDHYFTSACATPASVFPTIMRLSHHWTGKAEYGTNLEKNIQTVLNMLEARPFPSRLTLDEQGVFVLGYYHQRAAFYHKKGNHAEEATQSNNIDS